MDHAEGIHPCAGHKEETKCTRFLPLNCLPSIWKGENRGKSPHYQTGQRPNKQHGQRVLRRLWWSQKEVTCLSLETALERWVGLAQAIMRPRTWLGLRVCLGGEFWKESWGNTSVEHPECQAEMCVMKVWVKNGNSDLNICREDGCCVHILLLP